MADFIKLNGYDVKDAIARSQITQLNDRIDQLPDLYGKKMIIMGDSLSGGYSQYGTVGKTWADILADKYNMTVVNNSISGAKISSGGTQAYSSDMCLAIDQILNDNPTCDIFIVSGGANDKNSDVEMGSINNIQNTTFIGAIKNMIVKIDRKYGSTCKILFMTTFHRYDTSNTLGYYESDYVNAMIQACSLFSVPCFNNYNNSGIALNDTQYTNRPYNWADSGRDSGSTPTYHFSVKAYKYLAKIYEKFITNQYIANNSTQYIQLTDNNGYIWTRRRLSDGSSIITFKKEIIVDLPNTLDDKIYASNVQVLTPPADIVNPQASILAISVSASGQGFVGTVMNGSQNSGRIGFCVFKAGLSGPATSQTLTVLGTAIIIG